MKDLATPAEIGPTDAEAAALRPAPRTSDAALRPARRSATREGGTFADDVRRDLSLVPKRLQPKYLYDDLGSSLFAAICQLPWYQVTRAEKRLLTTHRDDIVSTDRGHLRIIELGCGNGEKLRVLAEEVRRCNADIDIHLVDVSALALEQSSVALADLEMPVLPHEATYETGLREACASRADDEETLVLFLGSNIGNFEPPEALDFLVSMRDALQACDRLLLGVDLVRPVPDLLLAYDDPLGVTAAFNKNLLVRINRELDADFDLAAFSHRACWNSADSRVEMHLMSTRAQRVTIPGAQCHVSFDAGETIWTESSYKYEPDRVQEMARMAGFSCRACWIDDAARFGSFLFVAR